MIGGGLQRARSPFAAPPPPAVAEAIVQSLALDCVEGHKYAIGSKQGEGPGQDPAKWAALFRGVPAPVGVA